MPSVSDAIKNTPDLTGYSQTPVSNPAISAPNLDLQPTYPNMMRCPLPPIFTAQADSLRQFYIGSKVPQTRLLSAVTGNTNTGGGSTGGNSVVSVTDNSGTIVPTSPTLKQASITTAVLNPGNLFQNTIAMAKGFQLVSVATSAPARVELYGTAQAQTQDSYRGLDVPTPAGTVQNLICDIALDTAPYQWGFQNRTGANGDNPQISSVYITITNIGLASIPITVTFQYIPSES